MMNKKYESFEKFWNTEIISSVTKEIDMAMWGDLDKNDAVFIFNAGYNACKEALEQPAQEPRHVGWAWIHKDGSIWEFDPLKSGEETLGMDYVKLYTHPKQPLSNDELKAIQDNTWAIQPSDMREFNTFKFARAIEQAHGIGEDNE